MEQILAQHPKLWNGIANKIRIVPDYKKENAVVKKIFVTEQPTKINRKPNIHQKSFNSFTYKGMF